MTASWRAMESCLNFGPAKISLIEDTVLKVKSVGVEGLLDRGMYGSFAMRWSIVWCRHADGSATPGLIYINQSTYETDLINYLQRCILEFASRLSADFERHVASRALILSRI